MAPVDLSRHAKIDLGLPSCRNGLANKHIVWGDVWNPDVKGVQCNLNLCDMAPLYWAILVFSSWCVALAFSNGVGKMGWNAEQLKICQNLALRVAVRGH